MSIFGSTITLNDGVSDHIMTYIGQSVDGFGSEYKELGVSAPWSLFTKRDFTTKRKRFLFQITASETVGTEIVNHTFNATFACGPLGTDAFVNKLRLGMVDCITTSGVANAPAGVY